MLFCPQCGTRNNSDYNFCYNCGHQLKFTEQNRKEEPIIEFKVNEFISLKLQNDKTVIFVNDKKFTQCKYLLIDIPVGEIDEFKDIRSIDEASEKLDRSLEKDLTGRKIPPDVEFWGHCSNLQAWSENDYDTRLLHSNLAFPLLKKLTDAGDPIAKKVFKDEIAKRISSGYRSVIKYLIQENYLEYLTIEEFDALSDNFKKIVEENLNNEFSKELEPSEIDVLLNIIVENFRESKTLIIKPLKLLDNIDISTQMGVTVKNKAISALNLSNCGIKTISDSIEILKNLEMLDLTYNKLSKIPDSISRLFKLKNLFLSDNRLETLPDAIGNLLELNQLTLDHNLLKKIPETMKNLHQLERLSIWGNSLQSLPESIGELGLLKSLGLSFNELTLIPESILDLIALDTLDLSNNKLNALPNALDRLESLQVLWINNNNIKAIPESILSLPNLQEIYLFGNPFVHSQDSKSLQIIDDLKKKGVNIRQ